MANKDRQIEKWQQVLIDSNLINTHDKVEDYIMANWASSSFAIFATWRKGTLIFTEQKLVYMTAFGVSQFSIDYTDIREVKKSFAGILPMGMTVSAYDKRTDKIKKYKFWLTGRGKWMKKIIEKSGIAA